MKKLLAFILAGTLALGMSVSGFGSATTATVTKFASGMTLGDGLVKAQLPKNAVLSSDKKLLNLGTQYASDEVELYVNLTAAMFGLQDTVLGSNAKEYATLNTANFGRRGKIFTATQKNTPRTWKHVDTMLQYAGQNGQLVEGDGGKDYDTAKDLWGKPESNDNKSYTEWLQRYRNASTADLPLITWVSSATLKDSLYFTDVNDKPISQSAEGQVVARNLTSQEIQKSRISAGTSMTINSNAVRDITMQRNSGRIRIRLTNEWVSTAKKNFEISLYLSFNGKRASDQMLTISGTIANEEIDVYSDYDHVDLSAGYVANALESNTKIGVDVGNGATIHTKFFKGKKYYGITKREPDKADQAIFKKYKDIDNVITFRVVGLTSTSNRVTLSTDYAGYYVYNKDMKYLGRANQRLPFSTKYYLANKKLPVKS